MIKKGEVLKLSEKEKEKHQGDYYTYWQRQHIAFMRAKKSIADKRNINAR